MDGEAGQRRPGGGWAAKVLILAAVGLAYASNWWPGRPVLAAGLDWLGYPPYAGFHGIFLPHLLLYSTAMAAICALLWLPLAWAKLLPYPPLGNLREAIVPGVSGGLAALVVTLLAALLFFPSGSVRWIDPDPWKIAGNIFSNFFEEFVWRGFLLAGLREVAGFWPAAIVSAASWALVHSQYPLAGQAVIFIVGIGFAWLVRATNSLWAPYIGHEVLDILGDSLIG